MMTKLCIFISAIVAIMSGYVWYTGAALPPTTSAWEFVEDCMLVFLWCYIAILESKLK